MLINLHFLKYRNSLKSKAGREKISEIEKATQMWVCSESAI